ncbi:DUF1698 domain-containing protein [Candidatus Parcubacteria bacterium]|nr:DUF1698 domain-containing protein [Candidatus Parcubacteria bacterium]
MQSVMTIPMPNRADCGERYQSVMADYGVFLNHSLIDIGCSNGYFMARFVTDGGGKAVGVEPDEKFNHELIVRSIKDVEGNFDICFYLDLHYHNGINYFPWIKERVSTLFVAPSGVGNNDRLEEDLTKEFGNHEFISRSNYANRNIYKVRVK